MLERALSGWDIVTNRIWRAPHHRGALFRILAIPLAVFAQHQLLAGRSLDAILLFLLSAILFLSPFRQNQDQTNRHAIVPNLVNLRDPYWLGCGLLAIGLSISALVQLEVEHPSQKFWWVYLASIVLFIIGAGLAEGKHIAWRSAWYKISACTDGHASLRWPKIVTVVVILILASVVRLVNLDQLPYGTWYDEAANGLEALRMWREPEFRPLYTAGVNSAGHYLYLVLGSIRLFGIETFSIRIISAAMGVVMVVAGYLLGREVSDHKLGLLLAFLLAISRWSINFGRLGMYNISTPMFQLLTLAFLLRASRRGSVFEYALAGVTIGLGLCFYAAFQLFLPVLAITFVVLLFGSRREDVPIVEPAGVESKEGWDRRLPNVVRNLYLRLCFRWKNALLGLAVTSVGVAIAIAPLAMFAIQKPEIYFSRVQKTALFSDKSPEERLPALRENIRKHLLMFNVRGDPNGRHNLPGEPMLDLISAGLFVIGFVYSVLAWRHNYSGLWLIWLGVGLLGGILSLDFEAPQSLRSIGAFPAATILVAIPIHLVWQYGEKPGLAPSVMWTLRALVVGCVATIAVLNIQAYFVTQARDFASWNAFSTPETVVARLLLDQPDETDSYVISLFSDHPTIRFLTYGLGLAYERIDTTAQLPILRPADRHMALILDADRKELFQEAKRVYPNAEFEEIGPPFGGPTIVYYASIAPSAASEIQGLVADYYAGTNWGGTPTATVVEREVRADWPNSAPIKAPFVVEWNGVLALAEYGAYQFVAQAPAAFELFVDENLIIDTEHATDGPISSGLILAKGRHAIRVRAQSGTGALVLAWRTPRAGPESIPTWHYYHSPIQTMGLLGTYYPNGDWEEPEMFQEIDQRFGMYFHLPRMNRPYSVRWTGKFAAPVDGSYTFGLQSIDEAMILLNGQELVASPNKNEYAESSLALEQGLHDIEIRYADRTDHTYINVYWQPPNTPPGTPRQIIPPELLLPPQANYELIDLPSLDDLTIDATTGAAITVPPQADPASIEVVVSGLRQPRGVAVADDLIYVAETGAGQVRLFDRFGNSVGTLQHPSVPFVEPFAIDIGPANEVIVLDANIGRVSIFNTSGEHRDDLAIPSELSGRSRGMHVDDQGVIWLANTPGGRIVAFDLAGNQVGEIGHRTGGDEWQNAQPVDVVHNVTGETFIVDAGYSRLVRYDAQGRRLLSWNIAPANTMDSAHIASDRSGQLYLSDPEGGLVLHLSSEGERQAVWSVRGPETNDAKPVGIDVDTSGAVWIADPAGGRLLRVMPRVPNGNQ